jgi:hypothetical protein
VQDKWQGVNSTSCKTDGYDSSSSFGNLGRKAKAALRRAAGEKRKAGWLLAQSNVAGDGQQQNSPFVDSERKPPFVIKLLHRHLPKSNVDYFSQPDGCIITENACKKQAKTASPAAKPL